MAKTDFKSVDEYIATHPEDVQAILQRVRSTTRRFESARVAAHEPDVGAAVGGVLV